ncbi:MAG: efflux RND transporter permease subunit [Candidatus Magnetominusculus sp. LBB02]|nr:efflux RND transporter permease subunit [Candidatus Magnetominusculus sp. LBB02]
MTTIVMAGLLLFGLVSYDKLPISNLPSVAYPTINITANYPGATADTMAATVATPLEKSFSQIQGINSMTSTSNAGSTTITIQFDLNRNIDAAAQDVNTQINAVQGLLPQMPTPPTYSKYNPSDNPIMYYAIYSATMTEAQLYDYANTIIGQQISMLSDVAKVEVYGTKYAVRIMVNPDSLASKGIGIDQVATAISQGNTIKPTGILDANKHKQYTIRSEGQLYKAKDYEPLIVAYQNGYPVRIKDIGSTYDSVVNDKIAINAHIGGQTIESVVIAVRRVPGSNTVQISENVIRLMAALRPQLPQALSIYLLHADADYIHKCIDDVRNTLIVTILLVIFIIFVFLRSWTSTVIPAIAIPLSLIGTFAVMYILGYSLDNLSMMALVLAVGFVVDDAVVMLENIYRHMEMGMSAREASFKGSGEINFTILSMTLSLVVVFIPLLFMSGLIGRLFREFSVTIAVAILISGFISLTLSPMMCSRILSHSKTEAGGRGFLAVSEWVFNAMLGFYKRTLKVVLRHKYLMLIIMAAVLAVTGYLFVKIHKGFLPNQDSNILMGITVGPESYSFEEMLSNQRKVAAVVEKEPGVVALMSAVGIFGVSNKGIMFVMLEEKSKRMLSADGMVMSLWPKINSVPGIFTFMQNPPPIQIGAARTNAMYQYTLRSTNTQDLYKYGPIMTAKMSKIPGLVGVNNDLQTNAPWVNVEIDRDKAAALGLTVSQIQTALGTAYGGQYASTIFSTIEQYYVILQVEPQFRSQPDLLSKLYIRSDKDGRLVPLSTVAKISETSGALTVNHTGMMPSTTVSFNLMEGVSIGDAVSAIDEIAREELPVTLSGTFQGAAQAFQDSMSSMLPLMVITILIIYMVLAILYESFIHPITILTSLPLAGFGAMITLMLFHMELNMYSFVGVIMLIGIVKKNGIMMVDFALELERDKGMDTEESIYNASIVRFRPIMMTTMAALFGTIPIALGYGAGGDARQPLGIAVVGGLVFSQMMTLYVTPVFYIYMDKLNKWLTGGKSSTELI